MGIFLLLLPLSIYNIGYTSRKEDIMYNRYNFIMMITGSIFLVGCVPNQGAKPPTISTTPIISSVQTSEYGYPPQRYRESIKNYFSSKLKRGDKATYTFSKPKRAFKRKGLAYGGEIDWKDYLCGKIYGEFWSIFKKGLLGDKRFDNDLYGGEGTLWKGMLKNAKIYYIHKAVRNYRINEEGVSNKSIEKADLVIKNYERDIEYYGKEMKKYCPCYLATIYKGAAYFAKLSSQYKKGFEYLFESFKLCKKYKGTYIMFFVMFLPKKIIPYLSKIRVYLKNLKNEN